MNQKGFSLIEIMIAVGLLTAMSVMIYTTMSRSLEGKARVEKRDEVLHAVNLGIGKLTTDLSQAFIAYSNLEGQNSAYKTGMKGGEEEVSFSTFSHYHYIKNAKDTDQVTVGYELKKNEEGFYDLMRRESLRLSEEIDEGGAQFPLIENVKEFKLEYYDSNKREWVKEWDTTKVSVLGRLPQAVKISIAVIEPDDEGSLENGLEHNYSTIALVDLYSNEIRF